MTNPTGPMNKAPMTTRLDETKRCATCGSADEYHADGDGYSKPCPNATAPQPDDPVGEARRRMSELESAVIACADLESAMSHESDPGDLAEAHEHLDQTKATLVALVEREAGAYQEMREQRDAAVRERDDYHTRWRNAERELAEVGVRGSPPPEGSYIQRILAERDTLARENAALREAASNALKQMEAWQTDFEALAEGRAEPVHFSPETVALRAALAKGEPR